MTPVALSDDPVHSATNMVETDLERLRVHMVGIGGCGMSGLAALLLRRGVRVSGSDGQASLALAQLAERGARVSTQQTATSLPADTDLVVVSAAIPPSHPERVAAERRGLRIIKYAELLGLLMARYDGIAISGTHGKSTTTAWLTFTLRLAGLDPNFVIGATVEQLGGGSGVGDGPHFVVEACEYDRSFHNLQPHRAVILNVEEDHLDCYKDLAAIQESFTVFAHRVPSNGLVLLNALDARCRAIATGLTCRVQTFGAVAGADWQAKNIVLESGYYTFDVCHHGQVLGRARLGLPGRHNVDNALAVAALAWDCGVGWEHIARGLAEFRGAHRRLETRGVVAGVQVLDDYAHHPTEIRATLHAARERYTPRRLWCIFQPHQHSRTRFLLADFAHSFAEADEVVVPDIYFVRDSEREREMVSAADLVREIAAAGGQARYLPDFGEIVTLLARDVRPGDVVITMGAGNIYKVADELVQRLGGSLPG
jgi:UDP-N-acetylmuramate--alanine ligase